MMPAISRREIIRRSLRYGGLGAVAGIAAVLAGRARRCETPGPCGGCPHFQSCALPKAESAKSDGASSTYPHDDG